MTSLEEKNNKIDNIFKELRKIRQKWEESYNYPSLSEFIQSSAILIRIVDNEPIVWSPSYYNHLKDLNIVKKSFRLPNDEDNIDKKLFDLCESQYEFQMLGLKIKKDLKELNNKEITLNEFLDRNPEIDKGDSIH